MGNIYIDSINMTGLYGLKMLKGSYKSLVSMPSQRNVYTQSWAEYNGVDVDLTNTSLEPRKVDIHVYSKDIDALVSMLKDDVNHTILVEELGKEFVLRYTASKDKLDYSKGSSIHLSLTEDTPERIAVFNEPSSTIFIKDTSKIDDIYLSHFGIVIGKNGLAELGDDSIREDLIVKSKVVDGQSYDEQGYMSSKEKDVSIPMLMRAGSVAEFWSNRNALLYLLTDKNLHKLNDKVFYYTKSKTNAFFIDSGIVWWDFDLDLVFTNND